MNWSIVTDAVDHLTQDPFWKSVIIGLIAISFTSIYKVAKSIFSWISTKYSGYSLGGFWLAFDSNSGNWSEPNIDLIKIRHNKEKLSIKMWLFSSRVDRVCKYKASGVYRSGKIVFNFWDIRRDDNEIGAYIMKQYAQGFVGPYVLYSTRLEHNDLDISDKNRLMVRVKLPLIVRFKQLIGFIPYKDIKDIEAKFQNFMENCKKTYKNRKSNGANKTLQPTGGS